MLTTNIAELTANTRVSTIGELLDRGLPPQVVSGSNELGVSVTSGATMVEAINITATGLAIDPRFISIVDVIPIFQSPLETATFFIGLKYGELGSAGGVLGSTSTAVTVCPDGEGFYRHFQGGSIYWHPATGAHAVLVGIRDKWAALGWERGFLGYPVTDEIKGRDMRELGSFSRFQGGRIYRYHNLSVAQPPVVFDASVMAVAAPTTFAVSAVKTRALATQLKADAEARAQPDLPLTTLPVTPLFLPSLYEVHGAIRRKYDMLGAEASFLGYPTTDETATPDGIGRYNHFQAGSIYWTPSTSAWEVHGLIRNYWASTGWERGALGYPISDELIPDRRIGHRRPESRRKPILELPPDTIKLPAEAAGLGFSPSIVNVEAKTVAKTLPPLGAERAKANRSLAGTALVDTATRSVGSIQDTVATADRSSRIVIDVGTIGIFGQGPASTPAPEQSRNRYSDFENGVVLWRRGDTEASPVNPWLSAADGTKTQFTGAEVAGVVWPSIQRALGGLQGVQLLAAQFLGTTGYWFDGLSVHNRRHRIAVQMMANRLLGGFPFVPIPIPVFCEIQVECAYEPGVRKVEAIFVDWNAAGIPGDLQVSPSLTDQLRGPLDALLWTRVDLMQLPDTHAGQPIALLSAKTQSNGDVNLYIEP